MQTFEPTVEPVTLPERASGPAAALATLVVVPTYDESGTVVEMLHRVRAALPHAQILVVDDGSPDGTADLVDAVGLEIGNVLVLRRPEKSGLGSAYRAGFGFALSHGYDIVVQMDADLSHDPAALPHLMGAIGAGADIAIGSRYVDGGAIPNWTAGRRALSRWGNRYAAAVLGVGLRDLTSGYRAFRADALRALDVESTTATGYAFQIETTARAVAQGLRVVEVPIEFNDRAVGESKMSGRITAEALALVTWWGVRDRILTGHHPHG